MRVEPDLRAFFEEQVQFRLVDGAAVEGGIYIGTTEFLPVKLLRDDMDAYRVEFDVWLDEVWKPGQQQRRDEILACAQANKKRFADLADAVGRQQVVPFVGSGMSAPTGLPTWSNFLRGVRAFSMCAEQDLETLLKAGQFEEAADLLASATNERLLAERVEQDLRVDDPEAITGAVRMLATLFPTLVMTTNLDDVLEHSYRASDRPFNYILAGRELAQYRSLKSPRSRFLLKLHGDCRKAGSRVLLSSEYDATYASQSPLREELALLCRQHSLLFLGSSLGSDRWVRLIREVAASDSRMPKHYCFLALPDDEETRLTRELALTNWGIYPIWYCLPHDESLAALLDGLLAVVSPVSS